MNYSITNNTIALFPTWSRDDFEQRVAQIASQFEQNNIRSIALWLDDAVHFACVLLAAWQAKVRVVLPPNLTSENIEWANENTQFWVSDNELTQTNVLQFAQLGMPLQKITKIVPLVDRQSHSEIWLKTSASSGKAKTIIKTAQQMWQEVEALAQALPFSNGRFTTIGSVSIQHLYGLTFRVMLPLQMNWIIGRTQHHYPEYLIAETRRSPKTIWISSPTLLSKVQWQNIANEQNIVGVISAGGPLSTETIQQIDTLAQKPLIEIYGSSETGVIATRCHTLQWKPLAKTQLGCNEQGALWVESPWIESRQQTADSVTLNEDGFELLGRLDRIIKLADKRISLAKIEQDLLTHQWVKDIYVALHPTQQRIVAWVALTSQGIAHFRHQGRISVIERLKAHLCTTQEKLALPRFWRFCTILPRNSQSKLSRNDFEQVCRLKIEEPEWWNIRHIENSLIFNGTIPLDLIYFKGRHAYTPSVDISIQLQWVIDKIPQLLGKEVTIERVDNLKSSHILRPNDQVELTLEWNQDKQLIIFWLTNNEGICSNGLIWIKY